MLLSRKSGPAFLSGCDGRLEQRDYPMDWGGVHMRDKLGTAERRSLRRVGLSRQGPQSPTRPLILMVGILSALMVHNQQASAGPQQAFSDGQAGNFQEARVELERQSKLLEKDLASGDVTVVMRNSASILLYSTLCNVASDSVSKKIPAERGQRLFSAVQKAASGQMDEAVKTAEEVVAAIPTYPHAHAILGRVHLGICMQGHGNFDKAEAVLKRAIALDKRLAMPSADLGMLYNERGENEKIIAVCKPFVEQTGLLPSDLRVASLLLAMAYSQKEDWPSAKRYAEKAKEAGLGGVASWILEEVERHLGEVSAVSTPGEAPTEAETAPPPEDPKDSVDSFGKSPAQRKCKLANFVFEVPLAWEVGGTSEENQMRETLSEGIRSLGPGYKIAALSTFASEEAVVTVYELVVPTGEGSKYIERLFELSAEKFRVGKSSGVVKEVRENRKAQQGSFDGLLTDWESQQGAYPHCRQWVLHPRGKTQDSVAVIVAFCGTRGYTNTKDVVDRIAASLRTEAN